MATVIDWSRLRPFGGSQNTAFEELCCQLAGHEYAPEGGRTFVRKGAPDAGVECHWVLPDGSEHAWQAKFFRSRPEETQWSQVDKSVSGALKKHPRLTRYVVCMPLDRQDPRQENQEWFMDKWDDRVRRWTSQASERGMTVEFAYWGQHEIVDRLAKEEHRGRLLFWFDKDILSTYGMRNQISDVIANVGPRYTPELNVELDINRAFDVIGRTPAFHSEIRRSIGQLRKSVRWVATGDGDASLDGIPGKIQKSVDRIVDRFRHFVECAINRVDPDELSQQIDSAVELCWVCEDAARHAKVDEGEARRENDNPADYLQRHRDYGYLIHSCRQVISALHDLQSYVEGSQSRLAMNPAMVLTGSAGVGKTHLLCDVAKRRSDAGLPTVLLLGGSFGAGDLWQQIMNQFPFTCQTKDEFLGILDTAGEAAGVRALILIDAINEAQANEVWRNSLAGILNAVRRHPWVAIAISVRESYLEYMIPQHLIEKEEAIVLRHHGFSGEEYKATKAFFDYYRIEYPSSPLLHPEFSNPQFLRLLCRGLNNRDLHKMPRGAHRLTWAYDWLIDSVNDKLSRPEHLNYDSREKVVQRAVAALAEEMFHRRQNWLAVPDAKEIVGGMLPSAGYHTSLFVSLTSEGILTEDLYWNGDVHVPVARFAYERFSDHVIVGLMLGGCPGETIEKELSDPLGPIGAIFMDEGTCWSHRGFVEALAIQIPERYRSELPLLLPKVVRWLPVQEAFLESLIWREPIAITSMTGEYFAQHIEGTPTIRRQLLDMLLTVAVVEDHPFNADWLHAKLMGQSLPARDASWSIMTFEAYGQRGAVDRLIDWAWSTEDRTHICDQSIRLASIVLSWFLTSSNRFLRDHATKALVALLTDRITVLRDILQRFKKVNDPYVSERLYAVAYGCAMRTTDRTGAAALAQDAYDLIFKDGTPPPDISLRDYARGVVEVGLRIEPNAAIDARKIVPPYHSEWPASIPSLKEVKEKYAIKSDNRSREEWGQGRLVFSVTENDFQRYVIAAGFGYRCWTTDRIGMPREKTNREVYDDFFGSLNTDQVRAWERLERVRRRVHHYGMPIPTDLPLRVVLGGSNSEVFHQALAMAESMFLDTLGTDQRKLYDERIRGFVEDSRLLNERNWFDVSCATAFILERVFTLGWDRTLFGEFDTNVMNREPIGRDAHKGERIGKKYQWIAYRELLARIADSFEYVGGYGDETQRYEGAWQISYCRDIDPSCIIRSKGVSQRSPTISPSPVVYAEWNEPADATAWLQSGQDLPAFDSLLEIRDRDGVAWFALESYQEWDEPTPPEEDRYDVPTRRLWLDVFSYLVKKDDVEPFVAYVKNKGVWGTGMPRADHSSHVFLGEFFSSPAFKYHDTPHYSRTGWTRTCLGSRDLPYEVLVTSDQYFAEPGYDCSIRETVTILLPCRTMVEDIGLSWNGREGQWFDDSGELVAIDPSVDHNVPRALLIRGDVLQSYLRSKGFEVVWLLMGAKDIIGGDHSGREWPGRLEISGVAHFQGGHIVSHLDCRFEPPVKAAPSSDGKTS